MVALGIKACSLGREVRYFTVTSLIDRIAHHGHLLVFEGESYRLAHALMRR